MLLLTGASGFFGKITFRILSKKYDTVGLVCSDNSNREHICFDLTETHLIVPFLNKLKPKIIVHSVAYRNLDKCESNPDYVHKLPVILFLSNDVVIAITNLLQQDYSGKIHLSGPTKLTRFFMYKTSHYESFCNHKFRSFREGLEYSKELMEKANF